MKLTFMFWNVGGQSRLPLLRQIVDERSIDVVVLAECKDDVTSVLDALNANARAQFRFSSSPNKYVKIYFRSPAVSIVPVRDTGRMTIRRVFPRGEADFLLAAVHLQSKLHVEAAAQHMSATRLVAYIEEAEENVGHSRTIICGDFNMDPFEPGMVGAAGFHGMMTKNIASTGSRVVDGEPRRFFYNPMWSLYGDHSPGPPGTYYYRGGGQISYFWHMFDQVLFRPELLQDVNKEDIEIVTEVGGISLLTAAGAPSRAAGSDHFPVVFRVDPGKLEVRNGIRESLGQPQS